MIEINLIPGSGKKAKKGGGGGAKLNFGASLGNLKAKVRDPYMLGAIGSAIVAILVTGGLYASQESRTARLEDELQKAVQDSTRYASVLREREKAEAKRDTVLRSLNMIRAIDDDRYIWPHIMDEVSNALPPYTWIVSLGFSGVGQATAPIRTVVEAEPSQAGADAGGARHDSHPARRQHRRHPGAHALHETARSLADARERHADELCACERQRQGSDPVPARHALRPPRCQRRASRAPRGLGEVTHGFPE